MKLWLYIAQIIFFFSSVCSIGCTKSNSRDSKKGDFFAKKNYVQDKALPDYENFKASLPVPIADEYPDLIQLYWFAWQRAFAHIKSPPKKSSMVSDFIDAAFSDHVFQWDTIFMLGFMNYAHSSFNTIQSLDNFYASQHQNGYICRELSTSTGHDYIYLHEDNSINPPLFAWAEVNYAKFSGDRSRYPLVYSSLAKYAEYLENARRSPHSAHQLYWNTSLGSGMDNSPRSGSEWVDMSSQMVLMYNSLSEIARALNKTSDVESYNFRADSISERIQKFMWDTQDGFFYDLDSKGNFIKHKTIASFWPLLAQVATSKQAQSLVEHLQDPKTFWRENIWPSLAADEPEYSADGYYWHGGVWAPTNTMILEGLKNYNFDAFAQKAALKYLKNLSQNFQKTKTLWEFYKPDSSDEGHKWWFIKGLPDFVGWSGIGPIQFLIEYVIGIQVNALDKKIVWNLSLLSHHGLQNLHIGSSVVSLEVASRKNVNTPPEIKALIAGPDPKAQLELEVHWQGQVYRQTLKNGSRHWVIKS